MTALYSRPAAAKLLALASAIVFALCFFLFNPASRSQVEASASGPTAGHTGAPGEANCTACHTEFPVNTGSGSVTISGVPVNYLPGQQYPITVTTAKPDAVIYGFQATTLDRLGARSGAYTLPVQSPSQMQLSNGIIGGNNRQYVAHTVDGILPTVFGTKSWTFTWTAPSARNGRVTFYSAGNASNSDATTNGDYIYTASASAYAGTAISSFDGDGKSDIAVWRPAQGEWYSLNTTNGNLQALQFGANGDRIVPGDYDGDGKADYAVFRASQGGWYILRSTQGFFFLQFGANGDIPAVGDYDGDNKSDLALYRPSTGVWYIYHIGTGSVRIQQFGISEDKTAQGDYDADGKTDIAVWRPSIGAWFVWRSTTNNFFGVNFGLNGDKPVQGDYDGDGITDFAVFRPSQNVWYLLRSTAGFTGIQFGAAGDRLTPADYDGDGLTDIGIFRNGVWFALKSSDGGVLANSFGIGGDIPIPSGYIAE